MNIDNPQTQQLNFAIWRNNLSKALSRPVEL
jgi:hypothetical protein